MSDYYYFSALPLDKVKAALAANPGHVFFDGDFKRVEPVDGQWFCEFEIVEPWENPPLVRDGSLVEYVGEGRVIPDYGDPSNPPDDRTPHGDILILQG